MEWIEFFEVKKKAIAKIFVVMHLTLIVSIFGIAARSPVVCHEHPLIDQATQAEVQNPYTNETILLTSCAPDYTALFLHMIGAWIFFDSLFLLILYLMKKRLS